MKNNSSSTSNIPKLTASTTSGSSTDVGNEIPLNQYFERVKTVEDSFKSVTADVYEKYEELNKKQGQIEDEFRNIRDDKIRIIEILGIFVAIFTFISVEIQILRGITDFLRLAGFTLIMFCGLSFLVFLVFIIAEYWLRITPKKKLPSHIWTYFVSGVFILIIGIILVIFGDFQNPAVIENNTNYIKQNNKVEFLELQSQKYESEILKLQTENQDLINQIFQIRNEISTLIIPQNNN